MREMSESGLLAGEKPRNGDFDHLPVMLILATPLPSVLTLPRSPM